MQRASRAQAYTAVSIAAAVLTHVLSFVLLALTAWPPAACTSLAAALTTVPTFVVMARMVWHVDGTPPVAAAVHVGWTVANVAVATGGVWVATRLGLYRPLCAAVPVVVYAASWVGRFLVLDRLLVHGRPLQPR